MLYSLLHYSAFLAILRLMAETSTNAEILLIAGIPSQNHAHVNRLGSHIGLHA